LSGPLAFIVSAYSSFETIDHNHPLLFNLMIDSTIDKIIWDKRLLEAGLQTPKKQLDTILSQYLPKRLVDAILHEKFP
jgi:predicted flavoprotein YhiN